MVRRSDRPTVPPRFDVAKYAKDSDANLAKAAAPRGSRDQREDEPSGPLPQSETRIATRPTFGFTLTDESWARSMHGAPAVAIGDELLKRLPLDHRAGFLMSLMDGSMELEVVIAVSGMQRDEALRIMRDLYESGVVVFQ
jgi:hypothetical protein